MRMRANFWVLICLVGANCGYLTGCVGKPSTFNAVQLTPSAAQALDQGTTLTISAAVLNDTSAAGVNWSLTGAGTLSSATKTTAVYNAPASVTSAMTVTVTATSVTYPTQLASLKITLQPPPSITTTSLPAASIGTAYKATVNESGGVPPFTYTLTSAPAWMTLSSSTGSTVDLTGTPSSSDEGTFPVTIKVTDSMGLSGTSSGLTITVTNLAITTTSPLPNASVGTAYSEQFTATGGTAPYTWSVASGSTLPAGLTLSGSGLLSGTPTTAVSSATFSIALTDSETPPVSVSAQFALTITSSSNLTLLQGNYAFVFSGFNSGGAVVLAGSFQADGQGNIKNGVEDFNSITGTPTNQTFTGTYTVGTNGLGQLIFSSLAGSPTYDFAIDTTGQHGRMIEADSTGVQGSGQLEAQSSGFNQCTTNTLTGDYAFGISGYSSAAGGISAGPVALAGRFTAALPITGQSDGTLGNGELDANVPGQLLAADSVSGTYAGTSETARCTVALSAESLPNMTFSVYPVSNALFFLVEIDDVSSSTSSTPYLTVGSFRPQIGYPFPTSLSGGFVTGSSVGALTGQFFTNNAYVPDVAVVSLDATTGESSFNISLTENRAGVISPATAPSGNFIQADSFGRVATTGLDQQINPVFYTINGNQAYCIGAVEGNPFFGIFESQSAGPFNAASIEGSFIEGTLPPSISAVPNLVGELSFDGVSSVTGTEDSSTSSGLTISGTYQLTSTGATDGSGTLTLSSPAAFDGSFYIISQTEVVMVSTTPGNATPVAIVIGHE
ncbi:MAG TPA: Ig domain-containing protein [Candidatus Cybelea sp.]|nr:Ig domain-containing protein [Candidatus Cybelea sp.]